MAFAGIEDEAFWENFIEYRIEPLNRTASMVYVPYKELIIQRWNQGIFILHSEKATGYPIKGM